MNGTPQQTTLSALPGSPAANEHTPPRRRRSIPLEFAVQTAIRRGFVVGREVLVGKVPGVVVGYNIGGFGRFIGAAYPLVIRTALGITKCNADELELV